jgi:hypothetical protein
MTKWTVQTLALAFMAAPLLVAGCGSSDGGGGTGGSLSLGGASGTGGAIGRDAGSTGGVRMDAGQPDVVSSPDLPIAPQDLAAPLDVAAADAAVDTAIAIDGAALDTAAVDASPAVDAGVVVCTMVTPFIGGDVTASLTLTKACSPYDIQSDINVDSNAILTIEAGVTLYFESSVSLNVGYSTAGSLVALGTAASPIVFTSAAAMPSAGDWNNIHFWDNTMGGTKIAYAKLDYCGGYPDACIVGNGGVKASRVTLDHLTIDHVGDASDGILENGAASNFVITNSTFSHIPTSPDLGYAISVQAPSFAGIGASNVFNGGAMIELAGGTVAATASWVDPGTAIAVTNDLKLDGSGSPKLTLGAGMTFMFDSNISFIIGYSIGGQLEIDGTAAQPVVLKSLAATPSPGDWDGLQIWSNGKVAISYANISDAGSSDADHPGDIVLNTNSTTVQLTVTNSSLTDSGGYGIFVPCGYLSTVPAATTNTFTGNVTGDIGPGPAGTGC